MSIKNKITVKTEIRDSLKKHFNILAETVSRKEKAIAAQGEIREQRRVICDAQLELKEDINQASSNLSKSLLAGEKLNIEPATVKREQIEQYNHQLLLLDETNIKLKDEISLLPAVDLCQWNLTIAQGAYLKCAARSALTNNHKDEALVVACLLIYATPGQAVFDVLVDCFDQETVKVAQAAVKRDLIEASGAAELFA